MASGGYEALPRLTCANALVGALDAFAAAAAAAAVMGTVPQAEIEDQWSRGCNVVACSLAAYGFLSMLGGARVYPHLLGLRPGAFVPSSVGLAVLPLMWSADPSIAEALVRLPLFGPEEGWRLFCMAYCVVMSACLLYRRVSR